MTKEPQRCSMCNSPLQFLQTYVRMQIQMMNGITDTRRYCISCCNQPELSVVLRHIVDLPVQEIRVRKMNA